MQVGERRQDKVYSRAHHHDQKETKEKQALGFRCTATGRAIQAGTPAGVSSTRLRKRNVKSGLSRE